MRDTHAQRGGRRLRCTCAPGQTPIERLDSLRPERRADLALLIDPECPDHGTCATQGHLDGGDGCYCGAR